MNEYFSIRNINTWMRYRARVIISNCMKTGQNLSENSAQ